MSKLPFCVVGSSAEAQADLWDGFTTRSESIDPISPILFLFYTDF